MTIRHAIRINAAAHAIRVHFGNETGATPLRVVAASVIKRTRGGTTTAPVPLTFGGRRSFTIPAGAQGVADFVAMSFDRFDEVLVSVRFEDKGPVLPSGHIAERVVVARGDWTMARIPPPGARSITAPSPVETVEVSPVASRRVMIAIGDSITEGAKSTPGAHRSWPEQFAERIAHEYALRDWVVINSGISGNRALRDGAGPNLLARLDRDVFALRGAASVLLLEGVNDIFRGTDKGTSDNMVTASDLIAAYQQVITRSHARGLRIIGGTILPFQGPDKAYPKGERVRLEVNDWIRHSGAFDEVVDFDAALRDPHDPEKIAATFDSGDHVHPSDVGYMKMARVVPLSILSK
ncbi:SGNH/GDSL hydrolase family protein [Sphingomonas faeni]|uniref:SGNH/GDSL hydrolase family protein n=1 Tax=Sphingomonas faeni TaxID=185950 RepID=UPI003344A07B